jgi:isocitrate dehydrogenase kinase/phosphatase
MPQSLTDSRLANLNANAIYAAFDRYQTRFQAITRRARTRFEDRDWRGMQADAVDRLDLRTKIVDQTLAQIRQRSKNRVRDKLVWASTKAVYSGLIAARDDWELAETFFNSITRRVFSTVGVDPQIEFVDTDFDTPPTRSARPVFRVYPRARSTAALIEDILADCRFRVDYQDLPRDARRVAEGIETHLRAMDAPPSIERVEMLDVVFYRGNGAYLIGRMYSDARVFPLVLALLNPRDGIVVDAVLLTEDQVSILFSFTRSYFHVEAERPYDLVHFLKTIIPRKRIAELYIAIGYHKHGKTELYRDLLHHLAHSDDQFVIAPGERGLVMLVFTLPSYDIVFKIIKDRFDHPKTTTREQVIEKYRLVFRHDRAGRLIDAQEFEHLEFDRRLFSPDLLDELQRVAANNIAVDEQHVVVHHLYAERRVTPLNIYVQQAPADAVRAAIIDYGNAIKDLAAANIFTGDLLLKNFGVTRHGRVVSYDYDELCLLTDCNVRVLPQPRDDDETLSAEPWFYVGENDFFPEEFRAWLGLPSPWREIFVERHIDLFNVDFWRCTQEYIRAGDVIHIYPYPPSQHLSTQWESVCVPS